jgi:hypothetical protein
MKIPDRERREWRLILIILLIGFLLICLAGELALQMVPQWNVKANMDSIIDPDATYAAYPTVGLVEPVRPEIQTPFSYQFLTPSTSTVTSTPIDTNLPGAASATQPSKTYTPRATSTRTPSPTATYTRTPTSTPTATATRTYTPTATRILPTWTPSATSTRPTSTPTRTPTRTFTPTPTFTFTPTRTPTATFTLTPTRTPTPTFTFIPTFTFTPTNTPTDTLTPSITPTPSDTLTPSNTPTVCSQISGSGTYAVPASNCFYYATDGVNNGAIINLAVPNLAAADGGLVSWNGQTASGADTDCSSRQFAFSNPSSGDNVTMYVVWNPLTGGPNTYIWVTNPPVDTINITIINSSWNATGTNCP